MIVFLLFLVIHAGPGEPVQFGGTHDYATLTECKNDGTRMLDWLEQDGVKVEAWCERYETKKTPT